MDETELETPVEDIAPAEEPTEPQPEAPDGPAEPEPAPEPEPGAKPANDEDARFFKQMSKTAREHFSKRLTTLEHSLSEKETQLTEAKQQLEVSSGKRLPDSYYEVPGAFRLAPDFVEVEKAYKEAQSNTAAWNAQLEALEDHKDFYLLGQDGKPVLVKYEEVENPERYRRIIMDARQEAYDDQKRIAAQGERIAGEFVAKQKQGEARGMDWLRKALPWYADAKANPKEHAIMKDAMDALAKLKGYRSNSIDSRMAGAAYTQLAIERMEHKAEIEKLNGQIKTLQERRRAGPVPGGGGRVANTTANDKKMTLDDFS